MLCSGPSPSKQGNLANGAYLLDPKVPFVSLESLPASKSSTGDPQSLSLTKDFVLLMFCWPTCVGLMAACRQW